MTARIIDMFFEPEHYNRNCGCTIPEGWVAIVEYESKTLPKFIGGSPQDLVDRIKKEFPKVVGPRWIRDLATN